MYVFENYTMTFSTLKLKRGTIGKQWRYFHVPVSP